MDRRFCLGIVAEFCISAEIRQNSVGIRLAVPRGMAKEHKQDFKTRAFQLAVVVFQLYPRLAAAGSGHAMVARQLLKAATSIGANLEEGAAPCSRRDMASKYSIALREAREANFWARLAATDKQWTSELEPIIQETSEFVAMLTVSVKKLRLPAAESS